MMSSFTPGLLSPSMLWWLISIPLLATLLWFSRQKALRRLALLHEDVKQFSKSRDILTSLLVAFLIIFSLARPYRGWQELRINPSTKDILVVVDISTSMLTDDLSPNRLEFAKRKLYDLIELTKNQAPGSSIGLVLFAGEAYLYCPPTSDYSTVKVFVSSIDTSLISAKGSSLNSALQETSRSLTQIGSSAPDILLITDGEDDDLILSQAKESLASLGANVFVLGVGTLEGRPIRLPSGSFVKDRKGDVVVSKLKEKALKNLAAQLGGHYLRATLTDDDLRSLPYLAQSSGTSAKLTSEGKEVIRVYNEFGPILILLCLGVIAFAFLRKTAPFCAFVIFCALMTLQPHLVIAEDPSPPSLVEDGSGTTYDAYLAYQAGNFKAARPIFEREYEKPVRQASSSSLRQHPLQAWRLFGCGDRFSRALRARKSSLPIRKPTQSWEHPLHETRL